MSEPNSSEIFIHESGNNPGALYTQIMESKLWGEIRRAAKSNPTLQDALDQAVFIYKLSTINER